MQSDKEKRICHIWHDNTLSDNYDLYFTTKDPNEVAPEELTLHCREDEEKYKIRWEMGLPSTSTVQSMIDVETQRAQQAEQQLQTAINAETARAQAVENNLQACCDESRQRITQLQTAVQENTDNIHDLADNVHQAQQDITNATNTANQAAQSAGQAAQAAQSAGQTASNLESRVATNERNITGLQPLWQWILYVNRKVEIDNSNGNGQVFTKEYTLAEITAGYPDPNSIKRGLEGGQFWLIDELKSEYMCYFISKHYDAVQERLTIQAYVTKGAKLSAKIMLKAV